MNDEPYHNLCLLSKASGYVMPHKALSSAIVTKDRHGNITEIHSFTAREKG
jgi:hypothetical protein